MISPETIAQIRALMEEASVFEEDLEESFILGGGPGGQKTNKTSNVVRLSHEPSALSVRCGETRSRETNRWLARRMLAELILERERGRKSAARQAAEKIRRQKRRRSRRQKQKMLADKHAHSEVKRLRRPVARRLFSPLIAFRRAFLIYYMAPRPKTGRTRLKTAHTNKLKKSTNGNQKADSQGRKVRRDGGASRPGRAGVEVQERQPR